MSRSHVSLVVAGAHLFVSGLAVGQKTNFTKFSKYEQPANIRKMEWDLLQARVNLMEERFPIYDRIDIANYVFDHNKGTIIAYMVVDKDILNEKSAEEVRRSLRDRAIQAESFVLQYMPEVSDENFIVYYRALERHEFITLAEYSNEQLSLH